MIILPALPPPDSILYSDPSEQKRSPELCPDWGKASAPARFQEAGTALAAKKDCCTRCRAAVLRIVIKRI